MRLISSIISQEKKENNRFFLRFPVLTGKNFPLRLFTNRARSAIIHPLKRACASGSMDRASDSGSEGWGFESLLAYQKSAAPRGGAFLVHLKGLEKGVKKTCRWHVFSPRESPSPISDASRPGMWMESEPFRCGAVAKFFFCSSPSFIIFPETPPDGPERFGVGGHCNSRTGGCGPRRRSRSRGRRPGRLRG